MPVKNAPVNSSQRTLTRPPAQDNPAALGSLVGL
jgi:hypothetical protein